MSFFEQLFPEGVSEGAMGGPIWSTEVGSVRSGHRFTNRNYSMPLHRYDVSHALRQGDKLDLLTAWVYVVGGKADGFRYKDHRDFRATQDTGTLTPISGSDYQLNRTYTAFDRVFTRKIKKPVTGKVSVYRTRAMVTSLILPTIDYTTGIVTVSGHVGGDTYSWSGEFHVPVAFESDEAIFRLVATAGRTMAALPQINLKEIRIP